MYAYVFERRLTQHVKNYSRALFLYRLFKLTRDVYNKFDKTSISKFINVGRTFGENSKLMLIKNQRSV